jgi:hypothetical protein
MVLSVEILQVAHYKLFDHSSLEIFVHKTEMRYEIRYTVVEFEIVSQFPASVCSARLVLLSRGLYLTYLNAANNERWYCKFTVGNYNVTHSPTFEMTR